VRCTGALALLRVEYPSQSWISFGFWIGLDAGAGVWSVGVDLDSESLRLEGGIFLWEDWCGWLWHGLHGVYSFICRFKSKGQFNTSIHFVVMAFLHNMS
jgi:hypothetical protein